MMWGTAQGWAERGQGSAGLLIQVTTSYCGEHNETCPLLPCVIVKKRQVVISALVPRHASAVLLFCFT